MADWLADARAMLAKFRLEFGQRSDEPGFVTLVQELQGKPVPSFDAGGQSRTFWGAVKA